MARLSPERAKPKRKRVPAAPFGVRGSLRKWVKSLLQDPKPGDLLLGRVKRPFQGRGGPKGWWGKIPSSDPGVVVKCQSSPAIAGSPRNTPQGSPARAGLVGRVTDSVLRGREASAPSQTPNG